jgi:hypothetical protein
MHRRDVATARRIWQRKQTLETTARRICRRSSLSRRRRESSLSRRREFAVSPPPFEWKKREYPLASGKLFDPTCF